MEKRVTSNKLAKKVYDIAFSETGEFFVTAGVKTLKYWFFDRMDRPISTPGSANSEVKCMASRTVDLAEMRGKTFVSVATARGNVFALTEDGLLCVCTPERTMDKWMDLHASFGYTICAYGNLVACGCSNGVIRCFDADTLEHIITLPRPPPLGEANISPNSKKQIIATNVSCTFADTVAVMLFDNNQRLFSIYSDRTVFIWDIKRMERVSVHKSFFISLRCY